MVLKGDKHMETQNGNTKDNGNPETPKVSETPVERDAEAEDGKEKELQIPIQQVPMDGVCGGY
jgi:hypothetical protein